MPSNDNRYLKQLWQFFKKGPFAWVLAVLGSIVLFLNQADEFQKIILKLTNLHVPQLGVLVFLLLVILTLTLFQQLNRRKENIITKESQFVFPKRSKARKALLLGLISIIPVFLVSECWLWERQFDSSGSDSQIRIFIDEFESKGLGELNLEQRIRASIEEVILENLNNTSVKFLSAPPEGFTSQEEKIDWACKSGATLVIYGKSDEGGVWPHVKICSDNVPHEKFKDYQTQVLQSDVTAEMLSAGNYGDLLDVGIRICFVEKLAVPQIKYLALFSLGLVMYHDDAPNLSYPEELDNAYKLFELAIETKESGDDCDLNYCQAWYYKGIAASSLANTKSDQSESLALLSDADISFTEASALDPGFTKVWLGWGNASLMHAMLLPNQEAAAYFQKTFSICAEALKIKPDMHEAFNNWGNALSEYAQTLEGPESAKYFKASYAKYAEALKIKPDMHDAFNNWGSALSVYALRLEGSESAKYFKASFSKYAEAIGSKHNMHVAYYNWGKALLDYAMRLKSSESAKYFKDSFSKFAEAMNIKPDYHEASYNWGNALSHYAMRLEGSESAEYFKASFSKYAAALKIKPDKHEAFNNWGNALYYYVRVSSRTVPKVEFQSLMDMLYESVAKQQKQECYLHLLEVIDIAVEYDSTLVVYSKQLREQLKTLTKN